MVKLFEKFLCVNVLNYEIYTCTFGKLLEIVQRAGSMGHGMKSEELREGD